MVSFSFVSELILTRTINAKKHPCWMFFTAIEVCTDSIKSDHFSWVLKHSAKAKSLRFCSFLFFSGIWKAFQMDCGISQHSFLSLPGILTTADLFRICIHQQKHLFRPNFEYFPPIPFQQTHSPSRNKQPWQYRIQGVRSSYWLPYSYDQII